MDFKQIMEDQYYDSSLKSPVKLRQEILEDAKWLYKHIHTPSYYTWKEAKDDAYKLNVNS